MIIYIHGFGSSGEATKAQIFRKFCEEKQIRYIAPSLSTIPDLAIKTLSELIESYQENEKVYLVGASLGGYYSMYLSDKYDLPTVLINPAIFMASASTNSFLGLLAIAIFAARNA